MHVGQQECIENQLVLLVGLGPVAEGVPATFVQCVFVFQDTFPEMTCQVQDNDLIAQLHGLTNGLNELVVRIGRDGQCHVKIEILSVQTGRIVFGVEHCYTSGFGQTCGQTQSRIGLVRSTRSGDDQLEWDKVRNIISTYLAPLENIEIVVFEPLKLRFEKGHYGPYAANLNKVLQTMNGTFITYKSQFDNPSVTIKILPYGKDEINQEFDKQLMSYKYKFYTQDLFDNIQ